MNSCCNHWKEAELVKAILNEGTDYAIGVIYFCPECGSSLKEEKEWDCKGCYWYINNPHQICPLIRFEQKCFQPKEENKWCTCIGSLSESYTGDSPPEGLRCGSCHKPYKPTPKLPEKLSLPRHSMAEHQNPILENRNVINQILDYLKTK